VFDARRDCFGHGAKQRLDTFGKRCRPAP